MVNPDGQPNTEGEYQLEIRRGPDSSSPLLRSFDTNDRMGAGQTLLVQRGLDIADGQIFTLSDGVRHVVFEYLDTTIADNQPEPGRLGIPFTPAEADYVIAQRVRDAINGPDAQAVLDVTASIADGTLIGQGSPMYSTSVAGQSVRPGDAGRPRHGRRGSERFDRHGDAHRHRRPGFARRSWGRATSATTRTSRSAADSTWICSAST